MKAPFRGSKNKLGFLGYVMRTIIVTDLTHFSNKQIVCTAGIDLATYQCIRPMPYLNSIDCKRLNILPGAILRGKFTPISALTGPHQEDMAYEQLTFVGPCNSADFKLALKSCLFNSIRDGFEIELGQSQKHIPIGHQVLRSIITIQVDPNKVEVVEDAYKPGKIKLNFSDHSGHGYRYIGITDLGFHDFAEKHQKANDLHKLNSFIKSQSEIYLRIGLSRRWSNGRTEGYWIQVNGLYTFPEYLPEIRSYL